MFNEYDVVVADKKLSDQVTVGCVGAILLCFDNGDYEVEFIDDHGESIETLTVPEHDLKLK